MRDSAVARRPRNRTRPFDWGRGPSPVRFVRPFFLKRGGNAIPLIGGPMKEIVGTLIVTLSGLLSSTESGRAGSVFVHFGE